MSFNPIVNIDKEKSVIDNKNINLIPKYGSDYSYQKGAKIMTNNHFNNGEQKIMILGYDIKIITRQEPDISQAKNMN